MALGELGRAEALLVRAVELARIGEQPQGVALGAAGAGRGAPDTGDIAGAVAALEEARELADPVRVLRLYQDIAQRALDSRGDPAVAARVFERLWERDPTDRRFWEPLLSFYTGSRIGANVERVARATTERLFDPAERNTVRMTTGAFLRRGRAAATSGIPALVEILRAVLADDPTHKEAIELLADVYL